MRALTLLALLVANVALAEWRDAGAVPFSAVTGLSVRASTDGGVITADVVIAGAGGLQRLLLQSDGTDRLLAQGPAANYAGGVALGARCAVGVSSTNVLVIAGDAGCVAGTQSLGGGAVPVALKAAPGGGFVLLSKGVSSLTAFVSVDGGATFSDWASDPLDLRKAPVKPLLEVNDAPFLYGLSRDDGTTLADETLLRLLDAGTVLLPGAASAVDLSLARLPDGGLLGLWSLGNSLSVAGNLLGAPSSATPAQISGQGGAAVTHLALSLEGGGPSGLGYGMTGGAAQAFGPIPDPRAVAQRWLPRGGLPVGASGFKLQQTACARGLACVSVVDTPPTLFVLFNRSAPTLSLPASVAVAQGGTAALDALVDDADGDPLFVDWQVLDAGTTSLVLSPDGGEQRGVLVSAAAQTSCAPSSALVRATVSDGLGTHEQVRDVRVDVAGRTQLELDAGAPLLVQAGGAPRTVQVAASVCAPSAVGWTLVAPGGPLLQGDGGLLRRADGGLDGVQLVTVLPLEAVVGPPEHLCQATPLAFSMAADAGPGVPGAQVSLGVLPWGAPEAPVLPAVLREVAPVDRPVFSAGPRHVCEGTAGVPATALELVSRAGDPVVVLSVVGEALVVRTAACSGGVADAVVRRVLLDGGAVAASATVSVRVEVDAGLGDRDGGTFTLGADAGAGRVDGTLEVSGVSCLGARGWTAALVLESDAGAVDAGQVALTGRDGGEPWSVLLPGCVAGHYEVQGEVLDRSGAPVGLSDRFAFDSPALALALGAVSPARLEVSCGLRTQAGLAVAPVGGACPPEAITWSQRTGPALVVPQGSGPSFPLEVASAELEGVAGEDVTFRLTATSGGQSLSEDRTVHLSPAPFVTVSATTRPLRPESGAPVAVELVLTNTTACQATSLTLTEDATGLEVIDGSARIDGARADAELTGAVLTVRGITLPAGQSARVTYQARLPLLGSARTSHQVSYRGEPVLLGGPAAPAATGCGCDAALGLPGFALLALLVRSRRRIS
ncbi:MAG: hypothetical protein K1X89_26940 [Myxococcaceae bacterium]|nr:hypothetical protein [Myxococcaceae bacterium]